MPEGRDEAQVQAGYDRWAHGTRFASSDLAYQCTSWARYRWSELDVHFPEDQAFGDGRLMAGNVADYTGQKITSVPSLHAMASYGSSGFGHVMIVEEVYGDGSFRVSEMNMGTDLGKEDPLIGRPHEYQDFRTFHPDGHGGYRTDGGATYDVRFVPLPKLGG
jgi:surface antigen